MIGKQKRKKEKKEKGNNCPTVKTVVQGFDNSRVKMIHRQCFDNLTMKFGNLVIPKKQKTFGKTLYKEGNLVIDRLAFTCNLTMNRTCNFTRADGFQTIKLNILK